MFFTLDENKEDIEQNVDENGDSFARDVTTEELQAVSLTTSLVSSTDYLGRYLT